MTNHSCIYEGEVVHRRYEPIQRDFRYRLFLMYVDLDELPTLFHSRWLWSTNRANITSFHRSDHVGSADEPLADSVRNLVAERTGRRPTGAIRLLTQFRYLGYVFNPLSLYYCFDDQEQIEFIVAEVSNTPWGDRHCYVLEAPGGAAVPGTLFFAAPKELHVSPFLTMNYDYAFRFTPPDSQLSAHIENWSRTPVNDRPTFAAHLTLHRRPITGRELARVLAIYPFMPHRIVAAIYWQAFRLWWAGVPFVSHPPEQPPAIVRSPKEMVVLK